MSQREAVQPGDVLRACTCTTFVFEGTALFGAKPPVRTLVVYGADDQRWPKVIAALRKGKATVIVCVAGASQPSQPEVLQKTELFPGVSDGGLRHVQHVR